MHSDNIITREKLKELTDIYAELVYSEKIEKDHNSCYSEIQEDWGKACEMVAEIGNRFIVLPEGEKYLLQKEFAYLNYLKRFNPSEIHTTEQSEDDWYNNICEAKKRIAFLLADSLLNNGTAVIPEHYRPYLRMINLDEFKEKKAFYFYQERNRGAGILSSPQEQLEDYKKACMSVNHAAKRYYLTIKFLPVSTPLKSQLFENTLKYQRYFYNLALILLKEIRIECVQDIEPAIFQDTNIPDEFQLELVKVDTEELFITYRSFSLNALNSFYSFLQVTENSELSSRITNFLLEKIEFDSLESTLEEIISHKKGETSSRRVICLNDMYSKWQSEMGKRLDFFCNTIMQTYHDGEIVHKLNDIANAIVHAAIRQNILFFPEKTPFEFKPRKKELTFT